MKTNYQLLTLISNKFQISEDLQEEIYKRLLKIIQKQIIGDDYSRSGAYQFYREMTDGEIWGKYNLVKSLKWIEKRTGLRIDQMGSSCAWTIGTTRMRVPEIKQIWDEYHDMLKKKYILSVEDHELLYPGKIDRMNYQLGNINGGITTEKNINGITLKIFTHFQHHGDCIIEIDKHTKKELFDKLDKAGIPYKKNLKKKYLYELLGIPQSWSENQ
jgi:hypothetical protein